MYPKPIRSFSRGLAVLAALNRHGSATALTLARETGVPRATVYRLLQTMLDDGYVGRGTADDRFHLRLKTRGLSEGFEDEQWISGSLAVPVRAGRRLLGCINTIWMARVISAKDGVSRCLEPLRETRDQIERQLAGVKGV